MTGRRPRRAASVLVCVYDSGLRFRGNICAVTWRARQQGRLREPHLVVGGRNLWLGMTSVKSDAEMAATAARSTTVDEKQINWIDSFLGTAPEPVPRKTIKRPFIKGDLHQATSSREGEPS